MSEWMNEMETAAYGHFLLITIGEVLLKKAVLNNMKHHYRIFKYAWKLWVMFRTLFIMRVSGAQIEDQGEGVGEVGRRG